MGAKVRALNDGNWQVETVIEFTGYTQDSLAAALDDLLDLMSRIKEVLSLDEKAATYGLIKLIFRGPDGDLDEDAFFTQVAEHPALYPKGRAFIAAVNAYDTAHSYDLDSKGDTVGNAACLQLGLRDVSFLRDYALLICVQDMDHENTQQEHIDRLIQTHGWCDEVLFLLGCRLGAGVGQAGNFQASDHADLIRENLPELPGSPLMRIAIESTVYAGLVDEYLQTLEEIDEFEPEEEGMELEDMELWVPVLHLAPSELLTEEELEAWIAQGTTYMRAIAHTPVWQ